MQDKTENKELPAEIINALSSGRKVEAIKLLREEWNIDLKEAKDIIEQYNNSNPLLNVKSQREGNNRLPSLDNYYHSHCRWGLFLA